MDPYRSAYSYQGAGMPLCSFNIEIFNIQKNYFRKNTSCWELMAYIGGFAAILIYLG